MNDSAETAKQLKAVYTQLNDEYQQERQSEGKMQEELANVSTELAKIQSHLEHHNRKRAEYSKSHSQELSALKELQKNLMKNIASCEEYCARVEVTQPKERLQEEIRRMKAKLRLREKEYIFVLI